MQQLYFCELLRGRICKETYSLKGFRRVREGDSRGKVEGDEQPLETE